MRKKKIINIEPDSIAEEMGIEVGDFLLTINDKEIIDILDYRFLTSDDYLEVLIEKPDGEQWLLEIEKETDEDLGLELTGGLMDCAKSCTNKCIFCFIDQLPPGMRDTLYFKDDDSRLSFLQGNYVTLTNMSDADIDRLIYYHLSPINISVHATDTEVRKMMLKNRFADNVMPRIKKLTEAGLDLNFQIVLCKGINDGKVLDRSIRELSAFLPRAKSLSVVPVGITKFRDENKLFKMETFDAKSCGEVIDLIGGWQQRLRKQHGTGFVFASDEFYVKSGREVPSYDFYEGFPQLENGVGMLSLMNQEFTERLDTLKIDELRRKVTVATGTAAYDFICSLCRRLEQKVRGLMVNVVKVENKFFGGEVSVAGLLTGSDFLGALSPIKNELGEALLISKNALRSGEDVFLDDLHIYDIEKALDIKVITPSSDGGEFIDCILYG